MHPAEATLYGLTTKNSNRTGANLWGKNQFNSTFPVALCLKMRDEDIRPVYVHLSKKNDIVSKAGEVSMEDVFGCHDQDLLFEFEKTFDPYAKMCRKGGVIEKIDLVVSRGGHPWQALEVKLTVVPDTATAVQEEKKWGPELVLRPASSAYAMMSVASSLEHRQRLKNEVIKLLAPACDRIQSWENITEISTKREYVVAALEKSISFVQGIQKPYLIQPIWKTKGQSFVLEHNCFDVFVWSDVAILRIPLDRNKSSRKGNAVSRPLREIARHVRALHELLSTGRFDYSGIYGGMELGNQTDKSFAISGRITRGYLEHERLVKPCYGPSILDDIILRGGENCLKPERRFDAAVVSHFLNRREA